MAKKQKRVKHNIDITSQEKSRKFQIPKSSNFLPQGEYPSFSLLYLDSHKHYCLTGCDKDQKSSFADKIRILSKKTWNELACLGKHKSGYEKIKKDSMNRPIPNNVPEDAEIISFRWVNFS